MEYIFENDINYMNYDRNDFNNFLNKKISKKFISTAAIVSGLVILDKIL